MAVLRFLIAFCFATSASGLERRGGRLLALEVSSANPIRKVVNLLEKMASKVEQEASQEKELYEKFGCYCKTGASDLQEAIASNTAKVPAVQSDIEQAASSAEQLKQDLKKHQVDRDAAKSSMQEATAIREKEQEAYQAESNQLKGYVDALNKAIPAIQSGMAGQPGFLQLGRAAAAQLRQAAVAAKEVTDYDRQSVLSFLDGRSAQGEGYVPKSSEVLGILTEMQDNFAKDLAEVEQREAEAVKLYDDLMAAKNKEVLALGESIEKKTARVGELEVDVVSMKNQLTASEAALIQDQKFLADLSKDCEGKKAEYEERVKTRAEELKAIRETIKLLNDDDALDLFKKTLPSPSFVQLRSGPEQARRRALAALLRHNATRLMGGADTRFLELALQGRSVDFTKVIKMIDNMVALLKSEQLDDDHKKGYCNMQINSVVDKSRQLSQAAADLEVDLEERAAAIKQLTEEIKVLQDGIAALDKSVAEATEQRKKEHSEYTELVQSNAAAKELLELAKTRLRQFYTPKLALLQVGARRLRADPGQAPGTWSPYEKKHEESAGVISMLDLLIRDLEKETTEATKQEELSQKAYEGLMMDSAGKRAKDLKTIQAKETTKANDEELVTQQQGQLTATRKEFMATEQYKAQLHAECDWLLQNFDLRKDARSEEIENLNSAKAVLSGADFSLIQASSRSH